MLISSAVGSTPAWILPVSERISAPPLPLIPPPTDPVAFAFRWAEKFHMAGLSHTLHERMKLGGASTLRARPVGCIRRQPRLTGEGLSQYGKRRGVTGRVGREVVVSERGAPSSSRTSRAETA